MGVSHRSHVSQRPKTAAGCARWPVADGKGWKVKYYNLARCLSLSSIFFREISDVLRKKTQCGNSLILETCKKHKTPTQTWVFETQDCKKSG